MKKFVQLLTQLEKTKNAPDQELVFLRFLKTSKSTDVMWAFWLLTGRKPKKCLLPATLVDWTLEEMGIPEWLYEESLAATGILVETCALLWRKTTERSWTLSQYMECLIDLHQKTEEENKTLIKELWQSLNGPERYWLNRLLLGNFRFKISMKKLVVALAEFTNRPEHIFWYRLLSDWSPAETSFATLFLESREIDESLKPYPFSPVVEVETKRKPVAKILDFQAEWFWEGIRVQLLKREGQLFIWSEEGEWLTDKFPEFDVLQDLLPDGMVLDGSVLSLLDGRVLEVKKIRDRVERKRATKKIMLDCPAVFLAGDVLEKDGKSLATLPYSERAQILEKLLDQYPSKILNQTEKLIFKNWSALKKMLPQARDEFAKGMLLRPLAGLTTSPVLFLPCPPLELLVVLLYVSRDERKPGRFSELSFAVWKNEDLVPIAKCTNTLTEEDNLELKAFVQQHTIERFGPVTSVEADLVFKISYKGLLLSTRKKSGLDLQFPILVSWEKDRTLDEVEDLADLHRLQRRLSGEKE